MSTASRLVNAVEATIDDMYIYVRAIDTEYDRQLPGGAEVNSTTMRESVEETCCEGHKVLFLADTKGDGSCMLNAVGICLGRSNYAKEMIEKYRGRDDAPPALKEHGIWADTGDVRWLAVHEQLTVCIHVASDGECEGRSYVHMINSAAKQVVHIHFRRNHYSALVERSTDARLKLTTVASFEEGLKDHEKKSNSSAQSNPPLCATGLPEQASPNVDVSVFMEVIDRLKSRATPDKPCPDMLPEDYELLFGAEEKSDEPTIRGMIDQFKKTMRENPILETDLEKLYGELTGEKPLCSYPSMSAALYMGHVKGIFSNMVKNYGQPHEKVGTKIEVNYPRQMALKKQEDIPLTTTVLETVPVPERAPSVVSNRSKTSKRRERRQKSSVAGSTVAGSSASRTASTASEVQRLADDVAALGMPNSMVVTANVAHDIVVDQLQLTDGYLVVCNEELVHNGTQATIDEVIQQGTFFKAVICLNAPADLAENTEILMHSDYSREIGMIIDHTIRGGKAALRVLGALHSDTRLLIKQGAVHFTSVRTIILDQGTIDWRDFQKEKRNPSRFECLELP